ncbi:MAG: AsmA family protein [Acidobacteria bacterium]|nr:AsmA family protein [Acidobacteriota bacterium]
MRKLLLVSAAVVAGLVALGAAAVLLIDVNQFREPIRAQIEKRLGRTVAIGNLGLKLFPLAIRLNDVSIGESPKFPSREPFLSARETYVRVSLGALLAKQVNVESVRVVGPTVELIRNAEGDWNFSTLGGPPAADKPAADSSSTKVEIADLAIEDGRVALTDLRQHRPRAVYDHIDIALRDFAPGKKFQLDAAVHLPGKGKEKETISVRLAGDTPAGAKTIASSDLEGAVTLDAVSLTGLQAFTGSTPNQAAKAVFSGKADLRSAAGVLTGKAHIEIAEPRLKTPARIDFDLRDETETGKLAISNFKLALGGLTASGSAAVDSKAVPSTVIADVRADNAALADVLELANAFTGAEGVAGTGVLSLAAHISGPTDAVVYDASGSLRDARLTLASLRKPLEIQTVSFKAGKNDASLENLAASIGSSHLKGNATIHDFAHPDLRFTADVDRLDTNELEQITAPSKPSGKSAAPAQSGSSTLNGSGNITVGSIQRDQLVLTAVKAACKIEKGVIRLDPLTANLFGGAASGSIAVDTRTQQTAFDVHSKIQKVDAGKLLASTTAIGKMLSGVLSGDVDIRANPQPGQPPAQSLNGTVRVMLADGKLSGVQLMNEMAGIAKFLGYKPSGAGFTNIIKLAGTLNIQNGVATTNDLQLQFDGGTLGAAGSLGLADQQVKLRVTAVLPKDVSQRVGGGQIAGLMNTALANSKGELVIPAVVTGTFDKPRFAPDTEGMAKMKLQGLLPTKDNPLAPVSKVQSILGALGGGAKPAADPAKPADPNAPAAQQQPQKKKGIFDVIDSVRKATEK